MEKLTPLTVKSRLENLKGWDYKENGIEKSFKFKDFRETFSVMSHVAFECEAKNHHPEWSNVYNTLNIRLTTHDAGGVTDKDLDLAKSIERIVSRHK